MLLRFGLSSTKMTSSLSTAGFWKLTIFVDMKTMSYISIGYAVAMLLLGVAATVVLVRENNMKTLVYSGILIAHALAQLLFSLRTVFWINFKEYQELGTMDNALVYGLDDEIQVLKLSMKYILLAIIASSVELFLSYTSARNIRVLFSWYDMDAMGLISKLMIALSITGAPVSLIYNLRTWNQRRIKS